MERKRNLRRQRAARQMMELGMIAPAVATRRLLQLPALAPWQAALQWNRWVLEKSAAFSLAGMAFAQASMAPFGPARAAQAMALRTLPELAEHTFDHAADLAHAALAPLHKRVRRNARRRHG